MKQTIFPRKHGFQKPFNKFQILSWFILLFEIINFIIFYIPTIENVHRIWGSCTVGGFTLLTIFYAYLATKCDPTDKMVYEEIKAKQQKKPFVITLRHYCTICDAHVKPRTKHCGRCNRCVDIFDHHCQWLNNCIGNSNYRLFIKLILSLLILALIKLIIASYSIILYYNNYDKYYRNIQQIFSNIPDNKIIIWSIFMIISFCLNLLIFVLILQLIGFHCWLYYKKTTTYEYIMAKRELKKLKKQGVQNRSNSELTPQVTDQKIPSRSKVIIRLDQDYNNEKKESILIGQLANQRNISENDDTGLIDQIVSGQLSKEFDLAKSKNPEMYLDGISKEELEIYLQLKYKNKHINLNHHLARNNLEISNDYEEQKSHSFYNLNEYIKREYGIKNEYLHYPRFSLDPEIANHIFNMNQYKNRIHDMEGYDSQTNTCREMLKPGETYRLDSENKALQLKAIKEMAEPNENKTSPITSIASDIKIYTPKKLQKNIEMTDFEKNHRRIRTEIGSSYIENHSKLENFKETKSSKLSISNDEDVSQLNTSHEIPHPLPETKIAFHHQFTFNPISS